MPRRCSHKSSEGFTAVELLVALTLSLTVVAAVMALAMSSRSLYRTDEVRTRLNQDLRSTRDLLVADVMGAGEQLAPDFPAIIIDNGASDAPDRLILRRNLVAVVLPVCADVAPASTQVEIADTTSPAPGCAPMPDDDADGWPDNLQEWRSYRSSHGGAVNAYLYDPVAQVGQFFRYEQENAALLTVGAAAGTTWLNAYPVANQCRLYVIEERSYAVSGELLQLVIDEDVANPSNIAYGMGDFQVQATLQNGTQLDSLAPSDSWSALAAVDIALVGRAAIGGRVLERRLSTEVLPRNVISR